MHASPVRPSSSGQLPRVPVNSPNRRLVTNHLPEIQHQQEGTGSIAQRLMLVAGLVISVVAAFFAGGWLWAAITALGEIGIFLLVCRLFNRESNSQPLPVTAEINQGFTNLGPRSSPRAPRPPGPIGRVENQEARLHRTGSEPTNLGSIAHPPQQDPNSPPLTQGSSGPSSAAGSSEIGGKPLYVNVDALGNADAYSEDGVSQGIDARTMVGGTGDMVGVAKVMYWPAGTLIRDDVSRLWKELESTYSAFKAKEHISADSADAIRVKEGTRFRVQNIEFIAPCHLVLRPTIQMAVSIPGSSSPRSSIVIVNSDGQE